MVKFKILEINQEKERIRLGIKQLTTDPFEYFMNKKSGDVITSTVDSSSNNGIQIYVGNKNLLIQIKKNHLAKELGLSYPTMLAKLDSPFSFKVSELLLLCEIVKLDINELLIKY